MCARWVGGWVCLHLLFTHTSLLLSLCSSFCRLHTDTANLASFFVIQHAPVSSIQDLQDAIDNGYRICVYENTAAHDHVSKHYPKGTYVPMPGPHGHFEGLLNGECDIAVASMNEWDYVKIDKTFNGDCQLEWVGRIINFLEAGFGLKSDSGRLCTSLIQDVLNVHLNDMKTDGTMDLIQGKFLAKSQDVSCDAIEAAEKSKGRNGGDFGVLTLKEMAGPFVNHAVVTLLAILVACYTTYYGDGCNNRNCQHDDCSENDTSDLYKTDHSGRTTRSRRNSSGLMQPANFPMYQDDTTEGGTETNTTWNGGDFDTSNLQRVLQEQTQKQASLESHQAKLSRKLDRIAERQDETIEQLSALLKAMQARS